MKIALGCDHGGYELKEKVKSHLEKKGYEVLDLGCHSTESVNYPVYGKAVGEAVAKKEADYGVVICGTGIGISIAANKVKGVRAALCMNTPVYGKAVGEAVAKKEADYGVVICGTGIGISIAANKVKGVRAALCMNTTMARLTREHNDANVLAFGARMVGDVLALEMVDTFLTTAFEGGRHVARVEMLED